MRSLILFASALVLAACDFAPAYPQFTGAAYRMEGLTAPPDRGPATHTVIYRNGSEMRVEAVLPEIGSATIVFDDAGAAYVLDPPLPFAAGAAAGSGATTPEDAAAVASNAADLAAAPGVAVRIDDAEAPQPLETAWAALGRENARSAGRCTVAGERGHQWRPRQETSGVRRLACITSDGIVLKVSENGRVLWEATSLQRGAQSAALFGVPAGYQLLDPQRLAARRTPPAPPPRG